MCFRKPAKYEDLHALLVFHRLVWYTSSMLWLYIHVTMELRKWSRMGFAFIRNGMYKLGFHYDTLVPCSNWNISWHSNDRFASAIVTKSIFVVLIGIRSNFRKSSSGEHLQSNHQQIGGFSWIQCIRQLFLACDIAQAAYHKFRPSYIIILQAVCIFIITKEKLF